ncbi:membrane protein [Oleiphilus messinensis]|uniref:Membrane protein n=2 Tax=Oleiphilus messinensis TaxID=141451 RepID=A0A1Y0I3N2_9GAMM|nr:membrane protein [Oleiphilus messinensis]
MLYPVIVFTGLQFFPVSWVAALLASLLAARLFLFRSKHSEISSPLGKPTATITLIAFIVLILSALQESEIGVRLYPLIINLAMLSIFAWSLNHPPTIIERFARMQDPELSPEGVRYTRRVTQIWCGYFIANSFFTSYTIFWGSLSLWTWYNGFIAYILLGTLITSEWLYRYFFIKQHD